MLFQISNVLLSLVAFAAAATNINDYKDQYCTDPRTMRKHNAYTEWADAYSCTRHRCQPGGRNLAIYTVGCKRVEAPESAIECEEVVEDTNMQFPYCCTRLRCLVVVRGEVWTRVLGQPWEILPAAPWSHMYKMKKPPPGDEPFSSKKIEQGPIYELVEPEAAPKTRKGGVAMRSFDSSPRAPPTSEAPDFADTVRKINPAPDIVIALSTSNDEKPKKIEKHLKKARKQNQTPAPLNEEDRDLINDMDPDDAQVTEKANEASQEYHPGQKKPLVKAHPVEWTENSANKWPPTVETDNVLRATNSQSDTEISSREEKTHDEVKSTNLQALVDAIGTRMKDIENVVQKMSDKVHQGKKEKADLEELTKGFINKARSGSKLREATTEPVFLEDNNLNGFLSEAISNTRRVAPKEPVQAAVYMAPVESARRKTATAAPDVSDEEKKQRKKHHGKRKHPKGHAHKKHHKGEKRKRFNKINSAETERNVVSVEDSASVTV